MEYLIALGSNLGDRLAFLDKATERMGLELGSIEARSTVYENAAVVPVERVGETQPEYLNAVLILESVLSPHEVLHGLLRIERELGRTRGQRWEARVIDLDLLAAGSLVINDGELSLPHPEMHTREFVLKPLVEVAPHWLHPYLGKTAATLYDELLRRSNPL